MKTKPTRRPWNLQVGLGSCFHQNNRVAITRQENEETTVTVAEVWPTEGVVDIADGALIVTAVNYHDGLLKLLKECHRQLPEFSPLALKIQHKLRQVLDTQRRLNQIPVTLYE